MIAGTRWVDIVERWVSLLASTVIGALACVVFGPLLLPALRPIQQALAELNPTPFAFLLAMLCAAAEWHNARRRWLAWLGLRHFFAYPPLWLAILLGVVLVSLCPGAPALLDLGQTVCWALSSLGAGTLVGACLILLLPALWDAPHLWRKAHRSARAGARAAAEQTDTAVSVQLADFGTLVEWLLDDREIDSPELDCFEHRWIAQRVAQRLEQVSRTDQPPAVAVIGPFGSGKTTVRRLTEHYLRVRGSSSIEIVPVSLWPYQSTDAALRGVLAALLRAIGRHVSTLGLHGVPEQYLTAVAGLAGRVGGFADLFRRSADATHTLDRIAAVARAINVRLVLWVEDIDRYADRATERDQYRAHDNARLDPLRALLHLLNDRDHISVVVAGTSLGVRFDLEKIARYVERIPATDAAKVRALVDVLRTRYLDGFPQPAIDPRRERPAFFDPESDNALLRDMYRHDPTHITSQEALSIVLSTPRILKSALRLAHEIWRDLAGEIDVDDVFVISALRVGCPEVFAFIDKHVATFRSAFEWKNGINKANRLDHPVYVDFERLLSEGKDERLSRAVKLLVGIAFPGYPTEKGTDFDSVDATLARPQSVGARTHTDYWSRYLRAYPVLEGQSDQAVLRSIKRWKNRESSDLLRRLVSDASSWPFFTFARQFSGDDALRLLDEVADTLQNESARDWDHFFGVPALTAVRKLITYVPPTPEALTDSLTQLMRKYAPVHIPMAWQIITTFTPPSDPSFYIPIDRAQYVLLAEELRNTLVQSFGPGSEASLKQALRDGRPDTLFLVFGGEQRIASSSLQGQPCPGWTQFASVLLDLGHAWPHVGIPQVLPFVTRDKTEHVVTKRGLEHPRRVTFDEDAAKLLFPYDRLIELLASHPAPTDAPVADITPLWQTAYDFAARIRQSRAETAKQRQEPATNNESQKTDHQEPPTAGERPDLTT